MLLVSWANIYSLEIKVAAVLKYPFESELFHDKNQDENEISEIKNL